ASTRRMSNVKACARRSVEVSTRIDRTASANGVRGRPALSSRRIDGRVRRSRGSEDRQTAQSQPMAGTPCDVPLPSTVILRLNDPLPTVPGLDETEPQLVEQLLEQAALLSRQVAARLLFEQREDLDHLRGAVEVRLSALTRRRIGQIAEMDRRR